MRHHIRLLGLALAISLFLPMSAFALKAHDGACNGCHRMPGANPRGLTNLCTTCHHTEATGLFAIDKASDALGHNHSNAPDSGSSHYWGGTSTAQLAAGVTDPPATFYKSNAQISTNQVTCSICHDPHGDLVTKPKLLRATAVGDVICQKCHTGFYIDNANAYKTHPIGNATTGTYAAAYAAAPLKFKPTPTNSTVEAGIILVNDVDGKGYVSCTSCHAAHFADSASSTLDGKATAAGLLAGDGHLLKADGPTRVNKSALCQTCHTYAEHGKMSGESVGCMTCHSGHAYNGGVFNYFVLRNTVTTVAFGTVTDVGFTTPTASWANGTNGYCEKCHGVLSSWSIDIRTHNLADNCATCHQHNKAGALRSFEASGCDGCHGSPPAVNIVGGNPNAGYAAGYTPFKDESLTPHASHSGAGSGYIFACAFCHNNNDFVGTHIKGSFQNVLDGSTFQLAVKPANFALTPSYTITGAGTCNNVACHSNGGRRTGDSTNVFVVTAPTWQDGTITNPTTCSSCHGNDATSMNSSNKYNSVSHIKHLNAGYTCNICHSTTAASNSALTGTAAGTTHVNGLNEVVFSGAAAGGTYTQATGTCAVVCHGSSTPDWDLAATGACGACHQYSLAGVATGSGTALNATHNKHVYTAGNGVQFACVTCHSNNGPGTGTGHADGATSYVASYQTLVCNPCHGATALNSGNDLQPVWGNTSTVKCEICHIGTLATINLRQAPAKTSFATTGHGSVAAFNTANPVDPCKACHVTTATHFNGTDNSMLTGGVTANTAFCQTCHLSASFTIHNAAANGSSAGDSCLICHESHGEGMGTNTGVMLTKGSGYTNGSTRASFANASGTGVCQTCHSSSVTHFNNVPTDETATHQGSSNCTACHTHSKTPAFMYTAGTACNQCHGNPPATNAHRSGTLVTDPELHSTTILHTTLEDRTDCATCHTGANLYTYDPSFDQSVPGGSLNHGNATGRLTILASAVTSVGYNSTNKNCTNACHNSTLADGAWNDANGLDCTSCHYYAATTSIAGNVLNGKSEALGIQSHNKHFGKAISCTACHTVDNSGNSIAGPLTHITDKTGANDLAKITGAATAAQDEATVVRASMTFDDGFNTCAGGIALGCHATGTPDWDVEINTATQCTACHSDNTTTTVNPTSGLHGATTPSVTGVVHDETLGSGCVACHVGVTALGTHLNGVFTGNGFVGAEKTSMGLSATYTATANDIGSCATTTCHATNTDNWAHQWMAPANYASATLSCAGCHGDFLNTWNSGITHRTNNVKHSVGTTYKCQDCHGLGAVAAGYTFTFGINDWDPLAGEVSKHGNGNIEINSVDTAYNQTSFYCAGCHTATAAFQYADTTWSIAAVTGDTIAANCGECHSLGGVSPISASGAHTAHNAGTDALLDGGTACIPCHGDNGTLGFHNIKAGSHGDLVGVDFANVTYSQAASRGNVTGTCLTANCHNINTKALQSTGWNTTQLDCDDCHFYAVGATTKVANEAAGRPLSATHSDHFDGGKTCTQCHGAMPAAGDTSHISGTLITDRAVAVVTDNASVTFTDVSAVTDYTFENVGNTCSAPTNNGLGCHATGTADWDLTIAATACTSCHTNTTTANVNPTSGLHKAGTLTSSTPHDDAFGVGGTCTTCHTAVPALGGAHINGIFTIDEATATNEYYTLATMYTDAAANSGTCSGATAGAANCHDSIFDAGTWARKWSTTAYNVDGTQCAVCHGGFNNDWTFGSAANTTDFAVSHTYDWNQPDAVETNNIIGTHLNSVGNTTKCNICHVYADAPYSLTWGTGSHGNNKITMNSTLGYSDTNKGCTTTCHTTNPAGHTMESSANVAWATRGEAIAGPVLTCGSCHTGGVTTGAASGAHTIHNATNADLTAQSGADCVACHGAAAGTYTSSLSGAHGDNLVTFAAVTYSAARGVLTGTCLTDSCHNITAKGLQSTAWNTTQLDCNDCHFYPTATPAITATTKAANTADGRPLSGTHGDHFDGGKTCNQCHGAVLVAGNTAHISGTLLTDRARADLTDNASVVWTDTAAVTDYTFENTGNTCYTPTNNGLGCHATAGLAGAADPTRPDWDLTIAATACTACHTNTTTAAVNPTSGLHKAGTLTSSTPHDDAFGVGGTCTTCHTAVPALGGAHINGIFTIDEATATNEYYTLATMYTDAAANSGTCSGATAGAANCHDSIFDAGTWARKWSTTAYNVDGTQCAVCHGGFNNDWTFGSADNSADFAVSHTKDWNTDAVSNELIGSHLNATGNTTKCNICHVYADAPYSLTWGTGSHGNNKITMNSTLGYSDSNKGCTTTCHITNPAGHTMESSANVVWATRGEAIAGPALTCGSCHTGGVTTGAASGAHTIHNATNADLTAQSGADCVACHGAAASTYSSALSGAHGDGSVTFANVTYSTAVRNDVNGTCLTANCHNVNTKALQSTAWSSTQLDCDDCHFYAVGATTKLANEAAGRPLSATHSDHFDGGKTCTQCHGVMPVAGDTTHITTRTSLADMAVAVVADNASVAWTDVSAVTDYTFENTGNTCYTPTNNGLGCHATAGLAGAADPTRPDWDLIIAATACTACHTNTTTAAVNPTSGLHKAGTLTSSTPHDDAFGVGGTCTTCHTAVPALGAAHINGTFTVNEATATNEYYTLATMYTDAALNAGTCAGATAGAANCHDSIFDAGTWARKWSLTAYNVDGTQCAVCHGGFNNDWTFGSADNSTDFAVSHTKDWNTDAVSNELIGVHKDALGNTSKCSTCHVYGDAPYSLTWGTGSHGNNKITMNATMGYSDSNKGCTTTCHTTNPLGHTMESSANVVWATRGETLVGPALTCGSCHTGGVTTGAASGAHTLHNATNADLTANSGADCVNCHGAAAGTYTSALSGAHGDNLVTFAAVTYSAARGVLTGTCLTDSCHNITAKGLQSTAWNSTQLDCNDCHFYPTATPAITVTTKAANTADGRPLSGTHGDHFDGGKTCNQCHGAVLVAGDTAHISGTLLTDRARADLTDNASVVWTDAAAVTDYTFENTGNTCYTPTNNGLGCHATAGLAGAADPTRPDWDLTIAATACTACHTNTTTAAVNPTSGLHKAGTLTSSTPHDDAFGVSGTCTTCHTAVPALGAAHINGTFTVNEATATNEYYTLATMYTDAALNAGTCAGATAGAANCHDSIFDAGTWARKWSLTAYNVDGTQCAVCHGGFNNDWTFGSADNSTDFAVSHTKDWNTDAVSNELIGVHKDALGNTSKCSTCHVYGDAPYSLTWGTGSHGNNKITMNATMGYSDSNKGCTTTCHATNPAGHTMESSANALWATRGETLAGPAIACGACHSGGVTTSTASGAHTLHNATNADLTANSGADCVNCHGAAAGTYTSALSGAHGDNLVTFANVTYSAARGVLTGTCLTANCHNINTKTLQSTGWNTTQLDCDDCHFYAAGATTKAANTAAGRPLSATHGDHFDGGKTCTQCHGAMPAAGDTAHINGVTTLVDKAVAAITDVASVVFTDVSAVTDYTFENTGNTCYTPTNNGLGCHATAGLAGAADPTRPDWDLTIAATACTACHTNTTTAAVNPTSGLHKAGTLTSSTPHDDAFATGGTCTTCHTAVPALGGAHINGSFTANETTATNEFYTLATMYTDAAQNAGTCAGATAGAAGCHSDGGAWGRKWNVSAYLSDGTECANCHGDFTAGFVTGMALRHQTATGDPNLGVANNHADAGGTLKCYICHAYGDASYTAGMHRDNSIQINSSVTVVDNGTTLGCTGCHGTLNVLTTDGNHGFTDVVQVNGRWTLAPIAGPVADCNSCHTSNGMTHLGANESVTVHDLHNNSTLLGASVCTDCHTNAGSGADHNNTTVNFGNKLSNTINYAKLANYGGTCAAASNGCHDSDAGEWIANSLGADACADCHATAAGTMGALTGRLYPPTSAKHTVHIANSVKVPNDCADCHGTGAATGTHATHKNGAIDDSVTYVTGTQTCTNTCHLANTATDWTVGGVLTCVDCHTATGLSLYTSAVWPPNTNKHPQHLDVTIPVYGDAVNHSTAAQYDYGCGMCHGNTAANHANGTTNITVTNWTLATKTCGQNSCHQDGNAGPPLVTADWDAVAPAQNCNLCHGNSPTTGSHTSHAVGIHYNDIFTGTTGKASSGNFDTSAHGNSAYSTTISCNICHSGTVTLAANVGNSACSSCHSDLNVAATGNEMATIGNKANHVNGTTEVQFVNTPVRSKAQLRNTITTVPDLDNSWSRVGTYKTAGTYDQSKSALNSGTFNGSTTCSNISCHNGRPATWGGASSCINCHTALP